MKRYSGLHDKLCTIENIEVADDNARKNKNKKYGINKHDKNRQYENEDLVDKLFNLKYKTSKYSLYKIYEPKERIIITKYDWRIYTKNRKENIKPQI